jgi:hypothetical protein
LRRKGSVGVLAVVGGALAMTLYALTREPNVPVAASTNAVGHSITTETDTSAVRRAAEPSPVVPSQSSASSSSAALQPVESAQRLERAEPANIFDQSSIARSDSDRRANRRAKATASKRHSSAKEPKERERDRDRDRDRDTVTRDRDRDRDTGSRESIAKRGPIVDVSARSAPTESRQSAGIPGADISRQDF